MDIKRFVLFGFILLNLFGFGLVSSEVYDLEDQVEGISDKAEDISELPDRIQTKWDYLGEEWKKNILKNNFVSSVDGFFSKASFIFEIFLNEPYNFSFSFFLVLLFWVVLLVLMFKLIKDMEIFPGSVSFILPLLVMMLISRTGTIHNVVGFFGNLFVFFETPWVKAIFGLIIFILIVLVFRFEGVISELYRQEVKKIEKYEEKQNRFVLRAFANAIVKGFGGGK